MVKASKKEKAAARVNKLTPHSKFKVFHDPDATGVPLAKRKNAQTRMHCVTSSNTRMQCDHMHRTNKRSDPDAIL